MLPFLRKLRNSSVQSGFTRIYILYGLGEILLVMVGILLALQVNNWNDLRKQKQIEYSILVELRSSIEENIEDIGDVIDFQNDLKLKIRRLYEHLKAKKPYEPYLDSLWVAPAYDYQLAIRNSGYDLLERRGVDIISNQDLKNEIIHHFNFDQVLLMSKLSEDVRISEVFRDYYFQHLYPILSDNDWEAYKPLEEQLRPIDYDNLVEEEVMQLKLLHRGKRKLRSEAYVKDFLEKKIKLKNMIDNELGPFQD